MLIDQYLIEEILLPIKQNRMKEKQIKQPKQQCEKHIVEYKHICEYCNKEFINNIKLGLINCFRGTELYNKN